MTNVWFPFALLLVLRTDNSYAENYVIMAVSIGPPDLLVADFKPTLQYYLTQQVSLALGRPVSFELKAVSLNANVDTIFDIMEAKKADFVYSAPYVMECLESEFDLQLLVTLRKKYTIAGKNYILNRSVAYIHNFRIITNSYFFSSYRYGGVIITRLE